jgi:hypothetical protein
MKIGLTQLFFLVSLSFAIYAQDTTSLTLHSLVGDSIDQTEKEYYQLFKHYHPSEFEFAKYLSINGQIVVLLKLRDKQVTRLNYSAEDLFQDMQLVGAKTTMQNVNKPSEKNNSRTDLYLVNDKYRIKVWKGSRMWLKTYSGFKVNSKRHYKGYYLVKIQETGLEADQTIKFRPVNSKKPMIYIPVDDIQSIRFYTTKRMIIQKSIGSVLMVGGFIAALPAARKLIFWNTELFIRSESLALLLLLQRNKIFHFDRDARFVFK